MITKRRSLATKETSSFRDPSGFIFYKNGEVFRQINLSYKDNYDLLINSKLYGYLVENNSLLPHKEVVDTSLPLPSNTYKIIKVKKIPFISYPYEWSFSQLKDAALLTLKIQKACLKFGMVLKDASAYNIQFLDGKPVFIDTLSFEKYEEGSPWKAYKQFCQHFLAPLALMAYKDIRLNQLLKICIDGIPLDLASKILPSKSWLNPVLFLHLHLHAKSQQHFSDKKTSIKKHKLSKQSLLVIIDSLEGFITKQKLKDISTEWGDYYDFTNYSKDSFNHKREIVKKFLLETKAKTVWDLGANNGEFSKIASDQGILTLSFDIDPLAVEKNYLETKDNNREKLLPLLLDLTNPTPSIGWDNEERLSLLRRGPADTVFALALIHHLAISNNLPFETSAKYLSKLGRWLIIEFVPKEDSQVQILLSSREDIFPNYNKGSFEKAFKNYYRVVKMEQITDSQRTMFLMKTKQS